MRMALTVPIQPFKISNMKRDSVIVVIGKRNSGKTTLIKDIMHHMKDIPAGCVISASEEANGFYNDFVPSILIKDEYKTEHISNLFQRQRKMIGKAKAGEHNVDPRAFCIMDDCMFDNKWTKDVEIRRLFLNGRHYRLTYMLSLQYPLGIGPLMRAQIDYAFILMEPNLGNRKRIYENYASIIPNFPLFCKVMDKLTSDYGCMVIDNTRPPTNNSWDSVSWYRGNMNVPAFRMCDERLWQMNEEVRKAKERERVVREEDDSSTSLMDMKKAPRVFVQKLMAGVA